MEIPKQIPNKITEPIVGLAFQEYRKALYAQLHDKHVTIHLAAIKTLVTLVLKYNEYFSGHRPYYLKMLIQHCQHSDTRSVNAAQKAIKTIIKESDDKGNDII